MAKYRKKPAVIEAKQFRIDRLEVVCNFITCDRALVRGEDGKLVLTIQTLEGKMTAELNDWIIKGVAGEFYPCKPEIFEATYELVEDT